MITSLHPYSLHTVVCVISLSRIRRTPIRRMHDIHIRCTTPYIVASGAGLPWWTPNDNNEIPVAAMSRCYVQSHIYETQLMKHRLHKTSTFTPKFGLLQVYAGLMQDIAQHGRLRELTTSLSNSIKHSSFSTGTFQGDVHISGSEMNRESIFNDGVRKGGWVGWVGGWGLGKWGKHRRMVGGSCGVYGKIMEGGRWGELWRVMR